MARVVFTANLKRHIECPELVGPGTTVRTVLDRVLEPHQQLRAYVLDEQGRLRRHMVIFIDGQPIQDRIHLADSVGESSEVYVMQALSGG